MGGIPIVVKNQIGTPALAIEPTLKFIAILLKGGADGKFGGLAIGVGRCGGDVTFAIEALPELVVGAAHMFAKGVTAGIFVLREIAAGSGGRRRRG